MKKTFVLLTLLLGCLTGFSQSHREWARTFAYKSSEPFTPLAAATANNGVLVSGYTNRTVGSAYMDLKMIQTRYNEDGTVAWNSLLSLPVFGFVADKFLEVDASGNSYLTASIYRMDGGVNYIPKLLIWKVSPAGNTLSIDTIAIDNSTFYFDINDEQEKRLVYSSSVGMMMRKYDGNDQLLWIRLATTDFIEKAFWDEKGNFGYQTFDSVHYINKDAIEEWAAPIPEMGFGGGYIYFQNNFMYTFYYGFNSRKYIWTMYNKINGLFIAIDSGLRGNPTIFGNDQIYGAYNYNGGLIFVGVEDTMGRSQTCFRQGGTTTWNTLQESGTEAADWVYNGNNYTYYAGQAYSWGPVPSQSPSFYRINNDTGNKSVIDSFYTGTETNYQKILLSGDKVQYVFGYATVDDMSKVLLIKYNDDVSQHQQNLRADTFNAAISSVREVAIAPTFRMYPNPAADIVRIDVLDRKITSIEMWDMMGRKVRSVPVKNGESVSVSLQGLPAGSYLVQSGAYRLQLVKQ